MITLNLKIVAEAFIYLYGLENQAFIWKSFILDMIETYPCLHIYWLSW